MKKLYTVVLLVVMMLSFASCSQADKNEIPPENKVSETVEEKLTPLYASEIKDGSYEITVESSSSMFRVVKCVLTVKDKKMSKAENVLSYLIMTIPHVLIHFNFETIDLGSIIVLFVLFGLPFAVLQRKRDLTSAIVAHSVVDLIRFVLLGI